MLGSTPLMSVLGSGCDNRSPEAVRSFIRAACGIGLHLLLIAPGAKVPVDCRTKQARTKADKEAQTAAREAGRHDWAAVRSQAGLALATDDADVLLRYLKRYYEIFGTWTETESGDTVAWSAKGEREGTIAMTTIPAVNLAVEVGRSRLVVVDCDTPEQMSRWWEVSGIDDGIAPTVMTPGQRDPETGEWSHSSGGHYYFTVPEGVELPDNLGAMTWGGADGFAVLWRNRYVLIPPSTRAEGAYEMTGREYPLPDWLEAAITDAGQRRFERSAAARGDGGDDGPLARNIDAWAQTVSWADILQPLGWTPTPRADSCGCAVWTAPGVHASPKSATAHDTGCAAGRYTAVNAPMHIWTDHDVEPFDAWMRENGSTLSKLQAVSVVYYGGSVGKAMDDIGLTPDVALDDDLDPRAAGTEEVDTRQDFGADLTPAEDDAALVEAYGKTSAELADEAEAGYDPEQMKPWCRSCKTSDGTFLRNSEGTLWHRLGDTGAGHLASAVPPPADPVGDGKDDSPYPDEVEQPDPDVFDSKHQGVPRIAPFSHWRDIPPPEYLIDGLIEHGGLSSLIGAPGLGKALSLDTPLPTPTGWTTMGEVQVGDMLLGRDGLPTAVRAATGVMYGRPCYEVEFSDGSKIVADAEHQWRTSTRHQRSSKSKVLQGGRIVDSIRTTEQLRETLTVEGRLNHSIRPARALQLPDEDLAIAPYTLGAWLGDGTSAGNGFTSADPEIVERIRQDGYEVKHHDGYRYSILTRHELTDGPQRREDTFTGLLRWLNVHQNKHIPHEYLRASERQRRDLLAGLLDTDGTAANGSAQFSTTCLRLMQDIYELIVSLGYRCTVSSKQVRGRTLASSTCWTLIFPAADRVFHLPRKADKMAASRLGRSDSRTYIRYVTAVRPVESVPVRCVEVNNDEHMYLAGRSMVPTHNSTVALDMACHIVTGKRWQGRAVLKTKVLYLPGEGLSGAIQRILAWEHAHGLDLSDDLILGNGIIRAAASQEAWSDIGAYIARLGIGLVIFDTFARMATGLDENSATEVGKAVTRFDKLREITSTGVMVVHHTSKGAPDVSRGSSALNGALDSELLVRHATWDTDQLRDGDSRLSGKPIEVWTSKQKNAEQLDEAIPLLLTSYTRPGAERSSALITGPNGSIDPMEGEPVMPRPLPEPVIETAIRVRAFLDTLPQQGATRTEIALAVRPDPYTNSRADAKVHWRQRVAEAVDRGLRYSLIETLSGTPSGGRYVPSTTTPNDARIMAAAEVMNAPD